MILMKTYVKAIVRFCAAREGEDAERVVGIELKNEGMVERLLEGTDPVGRGF